LYKYVITITQYLYMQSPLSTNFIDENVSFVIINRTWVKWCVQRLVHYWLLEIQDKIITSAQSSSEVVIN